MPQHKWIRSTLGHGEESQAMTTEPSGEAGSACLYDDESESRPTPSPDPADDDLIAWLQTLPKEATPKLREAYEFYQRNIAPREQSPDPAELIRLHEEAMLKLGYVSGVPRNASGFEQAYAEWRAAVAAFRAYVSTLAGEKPNG